MQIDPSVKSKKVKIGLLGFGNVGRAVYEKLQENALEYSARAGGSLEIVKVGVRNPEKTGLDKSLVTTDIFEIVDNPEIDIVIELMGGIEPARESILRALKTGKSVITANKALLATHARELFDASDEVDEDIFYEAAVAGAIPILRPMRESLVGDKVHRFMGIVNGTTNFILTKMFEENMAFADALSEAQRLGYAESDPTADISGKDAAAKAAILGSLAFHTSITLDEVFCEGIEKITHWDVAAAKSLNMTIKLLAIGELTKNNKVSIRVHPTLVPNSHPLASVRESFNAIFLDTQLAGDLMFYGRGAGGIPTASAVLGDLVAVARHRLSEATGPEETDYADYEIANINEITTQALIQMDVRDIPGVLGQVAVTFANNGVSIQAVRQNGRGDDAELIVMTHPATEKDLQGTVDSLRKIEVVKDVSSFIRVGGNTNTIN
jgi:homoserine dehydrogenase